MYVEFDDFRQSYVVAVNEIRKFIRGKKFLAYGVMVTIMFILWTALPFLLGESFNETYGEGRIIPIYLSFMFLMVIIGATLFASSTIVSEYEERTALVLFTRPIKKTSIFLGKIVGCIIVGALFIALYYLGVAVILQIVDGRIPNEFFKSLGLVLVYIVSASGVSMLISSVLKKSSISAVLTFFTLAMIFSMVSFVISTAGFDPWFMLDQAAHELVPSAFVDGYPVIPMLHVGRAAGVMAIWFVATTVLAWLAFIKREF